MQENRINGGKRLKTNKNEKKTQQLLEENKEMEKITEELLCKTQTFIFCLSTTY